MSEYHENDIVIKKLKYFFNMISLIVDMAFEISDKNDPIGTEIFDNNLPSNIDFD